MKLKLKVKPEDFKVEEEAALPLRKKGKYAVYLLEKKGWNTVDLILFLARKAGIPAGNFSYGGRKDRYGWTFQYIAVKGAGFKESARQDYSVRSAGFMDRPMGPDLIQANKFSVVVRGLKIDQAMRAVAELNGTGESGYPNYFDDQRFGSYDPLQGFLAEKLLKRHFTGAAKVFLCSCRQQDPPAVQKRREFFFQHWKEWESCLTRAQTPEEKSLFLSLAKRPHREILNFLPRQELSIHFSAYQSFLWNEVLRRVLKEAAVFEEKIIPGAAGEYLFYERLSPGERAYLKNLALPTAAAKVILPDELAKKAYTRVLSENGIKAGDFNRLSTRLVYFKSFSRKALVFPENPVAEITEDDLYIGKHKLSLQFRLPRGSFGTMLIKRIFC